MRILLLLFFVLSLGTSPSFTAAEIKVVNPRIINGSPVNPRSISIARIKGRDNFGEYLCSGTLIAPTVVLTARHCVTSNKPSSHTVILRGRSYSVSSVRIHPRAKDTPSGVIYDAALLYLRSNPRVSHFPVLTSRLVRPGENIAIYGYGKTSRGNTGKLYSGNMTVRNTNTRWIVSEFNGSGSNTCEGDSGGPAFATIKTSSGASRLAVVGVTSGGEREDCMAGDVSYFTNLQSSVTRDFLKRNVRSLSRR